MRVEEAKTGQGVTDGDVARAAGKKSGAHSAGDLVDSALPPSACRARAGKGSKKGSEWEETEGRTSAKPKRARPKGQVRDAVPGHGGELEHDGGRGEDGRVHEKDASEGGSERGEIQESGAAPGACRVRRVVGVRACQTPSAKRGEGRTPSVH
eukprot:scaffold6709_cov98-Isochrysis_galbana.AAC.2